jgi:putative ABC transport system permease protein
MVIITVVCLVLGLGTGVIAAQPVSDMLLENQLEQIEPESNSFGGGGMPGGGGGMMRTAGGGGMGGRTMMFGGTGMTSAEALSEMDVSLNVMSILQIIFVSLLLAIVASIVGIIHVTRYEPIKILSDRT